MCSHATAEHCTEPKISQPYVPNSFRCKAPSAGDDLVSVARFIADSFDYFLSVGDPSVSTLGGWNRCTFLSFCMSTPELTKCTWSHMIGPRVTQQYEASQPYVPHAFRCQVHVASRHHNSNALQVSPFTTRPELGCQKGGKRHCTTWFYHHLHTPQTYHKTQSRITIS
jgi:hypothetical protein